MVWHIRRCKRCSHYTLSAKICPYCGGQVQVPHPAKFSPNDKYARRRIILKRDS
ncbi:MAG: RNA-protein complex protein Nop10 [Candidatus Bathyarchaeota archaeon]|nr:MAG: RNA-protein complex protein Nop10 [Candidatus Bathyarchaeota archaeon]